MRKDWMAVLLLGLALSPGVGAAPSACTPAGDCTHYKHLVTFPANALAHTFAVGPDLFPGGVNWPSTTGLMTLTMHRPPEFSGDKVRLTVTYEQLSDEEGDIAFGVTSIAFNHGNSFETYGGFVSPTLIAPGPTTLLEQSITVETGQGWNTTGSWWYFEINRLGSFTGGLRVMAVTVEY